MRLSERTLKSSNGQCWMAYDLGRCDGRREWTWIWAIANVHGRNPPRRQPPHYSILEIIICIVWRYALYFITSEHRTNENRGNDAIDPLMCWFEYSLCACTLGHSQSFFFYFFFLLWLASLFLLSRRFFTISHFWPSRSRGHQMLDGSMCIYIHIHDVSHL